MGKKTLFTAKNARPIANLWADSSGSTYALLAAGMIPLLGITGIGLDLGRTYLVSSRLQSSVDAATLAAVRIEQIYAGSGNNAGPRTLETVNSFLNGNMATNFVGTIRGNPDIKVQRNGDEVSVTVSVNGTVPVTLMRIFGYDSLPVKATAVGIAGKTLPMAVETMMVLDNTGSMDGNGGMTALRASVKDFLNVVYGDKQTRKNFAVGMMPYNVIVNVGRLLPSTMVEQVPGFTDRPATNANGWKGCVLADPTKQSLSTNINQIDTDTYDMGKELPGDPGSSMPLIKPSIYPPLWVNSFHRQDNRYKLGDNDIEAESIANYAPMRAALIRHYGNDICHNGTPAKVPALCTAPNAMVQPSRIEGYSSWPNAQLYSSTTKPSNANNYVSKSPNYVCPSEALPVSYERTKSAMANYIDVHNQPLFNIGTWHSQAMAWGYRMLARDDVFPRNRPDNAPVRRVLIFMTDGNFDSEDRGATLTTRTPNFQRDTAYTGYRSYADKLVTNTDTRAAHRDVMALRFAKTCQAMKAEGIEIYTITFAIAGGAEGNATRQMFQNCSTNPNTHFFETKNPADLRAAFTTIAADLVDLHLSK
ncbi:pilus assembly protein TadG-related protein [Sphingomonas sp.]